MDYERFGKTGKPINGTRVFHRPFVEFNDPNITAESWIVVDDNVGTYTTVNTYDRKAGVGFDAEAQCYPITNLSESKWRGKGYKPAELMECPVVSKKVIFYDIDGVLCLDEANTLNTTRLMNLKRIVDGTGALLVMSSMWRKYSWSRILAEEQLNAVELKTESYTPDRVRLTGYRYQEIQKWLDGRSDVVKFAIVDDDPMAAIPGSPNSFFFCDPDIGLTLEIADRIIEYLND